ncbi:MAG: serine/threonine protein kinase [Deltaproteobacteria bacterium]|jgi:serine/threonine-protein kinase|nr:serine/threonine protein kinase [Deltaproteobacteria bacterium]
MASNDYTGQILDERYHVEHLVGRGGMGRVYVGSHARVGRKVAIKILNADLASDSEIVKRFFREARAAAAIGHRNIIDVIDVGVTDDKAPYLVMEYLEGESLAGLLERAGSVNLGAACGIVTPVLKALSAAHKAGIVHRDLKPENIFLSYPEDGPPEVKLIDFGISKVTQEAQGTRLTDTGQLLGTPAYMAPEQAEDAVEVDERTDIYAVGVILYELLSGQLPFDASSNYKLLAQVLRGKPTPPKEANPEFPDEAEPVVLKAMARSADDRYESAGAMLEDIRKLSAFTDRGEKLKVLASGVFKPTLPQGELGSHISSDGAGAESAEEVLADIVQKHTPTQDRAPSEPQSKSRTVWLLVAVVAVAGLSSWYVARSDGGETEAATSTLASAGTDDDSADVVRITVQGAPEGATILYDGAPVPDNPFEARKGRGIVPLRVLADGYEPFAVSVVPDRDKAVEIEAVAIPEEPPEDVGDEVDAAATTQPTTAPARPPTGASRPPAPRPKPKPTTTRSPGQFRDEFE